MEPDQLGERFIRIARHIFAEQLLIFHLTPIITAPRKTGRKYFENFRGWDWTPKEAAFISEDGLSVPT
jgi:hypothetical protein